MKTRSCPTSAVAPGPKRRFDDASSHILSNLLLPLDVLEEKELRPKFPRDLNSEEHCHNRRIIVVCWDLFKTDLAKCPLRDSISKMQRIDNCRPKAYIHMKNWGYFLLTGRRVWYLRVGPACARCQRIHDHPYFLQHQFCLLTKLLPVLVVVALLPGCATCTVVFARSPQVDVLMLKNQSD